MRVVVFDLDDTLYLERDFQMSGFQAVGNWLKRHRNVPSFFDEATALFEQGERKIVINLALKQMGIADDDELIQTLICVFREHIPNITLCKDTLPALQLLRKQNLKIGIITDGYLSVQKNKIQALDLAGQLDSLVYTDEFGRSKWKPHPNAYQQIMKQFKCVGADCAYVGDNPSKDFIAAKKLGWQTVRVKHRFGEHYDLVVKPESEAEHTISTLDDLGDALRLF